ncbi:12365_t:CDS:2 [Entrophospora sp. SA101]|nr:6128_t:CDS:2 [Entrophospora sp. SA101]CAJ0844255.1 12365_t:CDS:2 [Entrophospora sp. SA101]CAJ0893359.1 8759_t:CDS:2 [Entrophospora sp. SA101]
MHHGPDSIIKSLENQADLFFNNNNEGDNDSINTLDLTKEVKIEQDNQVTCGPARIRKLQILSHHYKIASKLEIYVGTVQRRKEVVGGMTNNINNNDNPADVKRTISWDKMPKIIENDGMCSDDESGEDVQDDDFVIATATNHNDTNYDLIKMNGEPYIHFKRLGYCALDSNERANYKAREFKSVRLDVDGEYIRLVARKCYTNHLNQYNQVGIVGITVMGEPANYLLVGESTKIPIENADDGLSRVASPEVCIVPIIQERCHQPHDQRNFGSLYSLLQGNNNDIRESLNPSTSKQPEISTVKRKLKDYLTANDFLQNQNETARLLLAFDNAKKNAVKVEDFPLAKVLKYSVELMKRGVEEVAKLDVLKHEAVVVEDFDNADKYKREIEAVRDEIRTALSDEGLDIDDQDEVMVYDPQLDPQLQDIIEEEPEELSNLARSAFTLSIQFFGDFLIASLLSKKIKLRELALNEIRKRIDYSISSDDNNDPSNDNAEDVVADKLALIKASYQVIQEGLNDHQEKLLTLTLSLWQSTINYSIYNQIPISSTYKMVEQTYPSLFTKITESDTTTDVTASPSKIKQVSMDLLILLIKTYQNSNHSLMENLILKPAKTPSQPSKQAKAKIEIVMQLIDEFGVSMLTKEKLKLHHKHQQQSVKMGYEYLMELSLSYLNNNNADAREMAVKLVFEVVKRVGKQLIEPYFVNNRNVKYPNLINDIWKLVTEHETVNGEIIQRAPTPDPIITKPKNEDKEASKAIADPTAPLSNSPKPELVDAEVLELTEEELRELEELERLENFEIDQSLLSKPLAKRGTVTRIEQQLMELRSMANNTNNIINEDYDTASNKPSPPSSKKSSNSSRSATKPSSSNSTASSNKSKKSNNTSSNAQSTKKTSAVKSKSSVSSANNTNKSASRRGSTDETKAGPKGTKKSSNKNADAESLSNEADKEEDYSDRCCIFCDEQNNDFTEENLVIHYWNECPLLTKCHLCNIILEISTLDEHMLKDCDKSKFVKQCQRCREIIEADDYLEHIAKQSCMTIRPDIVRCPLCKTVIKPATEAGWKAHLLDVNGCPRNRRKIKSDGEHNDGDCGAVATTNTNTATKESPSPIKKRSKATIGDSPKSAATKSSGSTTSRKTTGAAATTTTGKTKKTTSSSTTKVSRVKK